MNGRRIAGQVFLWAGIISAALAASSQREFDMLPDRERDAITRLPEKLSVTSSQLAELDSKKLDEMTADEFISVIDAIIPIFAESEFADGDSKNTDSKLAKNEQEAEQPITVAEFTQSRVTRIANKWPVVPWLWYCLSMAIGVIGVVLLRATAKHAEQDQGRVTEQYSNVKSNLANLNSQVGALCEKFDKMSPAEIVNYIDDQCAESFSGFADSRNALIQRYGLQPYAEIMTQFASAERFVNRTWSASADGYLQEAKTSILRARAHLVEATCLLKKYETKTSTSEDS